MRNYKSLLENLKITDKPVRRYSLSDMISESYRVTFQCKKGTNLYKLAEAHLMDVRNNPSDIDRLSKQLGTIKDLLALNESGSLKDEELIPKESHDTVEPKEERALDLKESKDDEDVEEKDDRNVLDEAEEPELTDEELEELTKHLETIRKQRKEAASQPKAPVEEAAIPESTPAKGMKVHCKRLKSVDEVRDFDWDAALWAVVKEDGSYAGVPCISREEAQNLAANHEGSRIYKITLEECKKSVQESASYNSSAMKNFSKNSSSKAFYKTFKKMYDKLKEGKALTRQEAINLYKAANSAMTHFSVELEHNPEFLSTFKECTALLSKDVDSVLGSLREGKAPSKKTMRSLARFYEALLLEDEEEEELPPIEDEEEEFISDEEGSIASEEEEEFDQEYADARVELHKELVDEHGDTEDPGVQEKLAQDAEEVVDLPGITDEQVAEITGEEVGSDEPSEETPEETPAEPEAPAEETPEEEPTDDDDITDDELAELKRHLTEMRKAKKAKQ